MRRILGTVDWNFDAAKCTVNIPCGQPRDYLNIYQSIHSGTTNENWYEKTRFSSMYGDTFTMYSIFYKIFNQKCVNEKQY